MRPIDLYFAEQPEPVKSCMIFLREHILQLDAGITEAWKYRMPFYCYRDKMFCYLWVHKKYKQPYIGFVDGHLLEHPDLLPEKRARMKILLIDPTRDVPVAKVSKLLRTALKARQRLDS
jgi:hypothetical protein